MATDRLTFIAELKDHLTGPAKKAAKAVEDLGKAAEDAAKKTEKANTRAERSEAKRARATKATNELAEASAKRRARAEQDSARRAVEAQARRTKAADAEKKKVVDTARAVEEAEKRRRRAEAETAKANKRHREELLERLANEEEKVRAWRANRSKAEKKEASESQKLAEKRAADRSRIMGQLTGEMTSGVKVLSQSMDGFNPSRMSSRYDSAMQKMLRRTRNTASSIQSSLESISSMDGVRGAQMGSAAVGGLALAGGVKRINDAQQANVVMETMGLSEGDRAKMMGQFKGLAKDTPFSTGSVANLGSGLISSGMDQSRVGDALQGAIDTAAIGGTSLEDMALPLKQIQAKGRLMGNDLMQLMDRNIPMLDWLAKSKGVDRSQVQDLVTKGQVSSDDVFKALAENSKGGAEKASKTLKGSWTNVVSAISQDGEAFLLPLVDPLTDLFTHGKEVLTTLQPVFKVLGAIAGVLVRVLTPALPVLIPLLIAAGGALVTLMVAAKVAGAIKTLAVAGQFLAGRFGRRGGGGAIGAVGLFTEFLGGMREGAKEAYSERGLGGLNAGLDKSTKRFGKAQGAAKGFKRTLAGLAGGISLGGLGGGLIGGGSGNTGIVAAGGGGGKESGGKAKGGKLGALKNFGAGALGFLGGSLGVAALGATAGAAAINSMDPLSGVDSDAVSKAVQSGNTGALNDLVKNAQWANGNGGFWSGLNHGKISGVNGVGDVAAYLDSEGLGRKTMDGITGFFGADTASSQAKSTLSDIDAGLAALVSGGNTRAAGSQFNSIVFQAEAAGSKQEDIMDMFPSYKQAVQSALSQRGQQADDASVLAAMRSDRGFRSGGYTGDGPVGSAAGVVHGREYVFDAAATARIGVDNLRAMHHGGNVSNSTATHFSPTVNITAGAGANGAEIRAHVNQALREAERRQRNTHGTRSLKGAH